MPFKWLFPAVVILAQGTGLADGGAVQLRKEAGDLLITVFASPSPLSVGPADISLLLQNRNGLEPVLDASVSLDLLHGDSDGEIHVRPTREHARNKLLYAAPAMLSQQGKYQISVMVLRNGEETTVAGTLDVAQAPGKAVSHAGYIAFPPIVIFLFVVRERLIRRRPRS